MGSNFEKYIQPLTNPKWFGGGDDDEAQGRMRLMLDEGYWLIVDDDRDVRLIGASLEEVVEKYKQQLSIFRDYYEKKGATEEELERYTPPIHTEVTFVAKGDLDQILEDLKSVL